MNVWFWLIIIGIIIDFIAFVGATFWISIPAIITWCLSYIFHLSMNIQYFIFGLLALIAIVFQFLFFKNKKYLFTPTEKIEDSFDEMENLKGKVIFKGSEMIRGKVEGYDSTWLIKSKDSLEVGDTFVVDYREGISLIVHKLV